ncbi:hypothetical protein P168DRAFT_125689 [Aspergillus campestris IBT 28561]|uniref:Uncharacterized protein n=1 Tax=Aspergillus campestris (strain IBT 28561) TaxID=1392248 RepID=A0A2I1D6K0_ASPC2|nr:uncharacterized protein P168DRAFT_125689 [Aspergillus campestris IBT 28561]PKY05500.1 hypothetical protein P168DRAFT_125689 [Aspergillus campestris IBT 28561]
MGFEMEGLNSVWWWVIPWKLYRDYKGQIFKRPTRISCIICLLVDFSMALVFSLNRYLSHLMEHRNEGGSRIEGSLFFFRGEIIRNIIIQS